MSEIRQQVLKKMEPGTVFTITRMFSKEETLAFGDLTRDYNPVHYAEEFARVSGYPDLICHGLLVGGMICEIGG